MDSVTAEDLKRLAAEQAANHVESGMRLGLGTGSTVAHFLELLGERLKTGQVRDVAGVPTSRWTESEAGRLGIPLVALADHPRLDLAVDGTDEVDPHADLIKGMGGALLREKMVAQAADHLLIIADDSKSVDRLGTRSPLPVEVVAWEHESHVDFLAAMGAEVTVRRGEDDAPFMSDNGNVVLDCRFPDGIPDPRALDRALHERAGVVETGLFLGMAHEVVLASRQGVRVMRRDR
jgi:ribose 5-phosphate isomerase A